MGKQRFLILGGSGIVGRALFRKLGPEQSAATFCQRPLIGGLHYDIRSMRLADTILPRFPELTHAFVFLGITNLDACARNVAESNRVNVEGVRGVIDDLAAAGIMPIFASSDAVFDGSRERWTEKDEPKPIVAYGRQKLEVEKYVQGLSNPWLVVRLTKVVSSDPNEAHVLSEWLRQMEKGEIIKAATDQYFSPVDVENAVTAMLALVEKKRQGVFHLGGPDRVSRLELLQKLIAALGQAGGAPNAQVEPCSIRSFPFVEARPLDSSLSSAKLQNDLKIEFNNTDSICQTIASRYNAAKQGNS